MWDAGTLKRLHRTEAWGHGGLVSTVIDLAKWDAALSAGRLLTSASLEHMWTPARLNNGTELSYGLGWDVTRYRGRRAVGHGGGRRGVSTRLLRVPDEQLTVILLIAVAGVDTGAMTRGILECFLPATDEK